MPPKKKISTSLNSEKSAEVSTEKEVTTEETQSVEKSKEKSVPVPPQKRRAPLRPVSLKYLSAQEFLLRKGVKPTHIPIYMAKAKSLGYTQATASEWDSVLFDKS